MMSSGLSSLLTHGVTQVASLANVAANYLVAGQEATRQGTAHPSIVPYQVFPTKDSFIMIGAGNDSQFVKLCKIISRPSLSSDSAYSTNSQRVANRAALLQLLNEALSIHTTAEWLEKMKGAGFPMAPVNNIAQTFAHPQAVARGVTCELDHPRAGKIKLLSPAVSYNNQKMKVGSLRNLYTLRSLAMLMNDAPAGIATAARAGSAHRRGSEGSAGLFGKADCRVATIWCNLNSKEKCLLQPADACMP